MKRVEIFNILLIILLINFTSAQEEIKCYPLISIDSDSVKIKIGENLHTINILEINTQTNNVYYEDYVNNSAIQNPPKWSLTTPSRFLGPCYSIGKDDCLILEKTYDDLYWKYATFSDTCGNKLDLRTRKEFKNIQETKLFKIKENIAGFNNGIETKQIILKDLPYANVQYGATNATFEIVSSKGTTKKTINLGECITSTEGVCNIKLTFVNVLSTTKIVVLTEVKGVNEAEVDKIELKIPKGSPLSKITNLGAEATNSSNVFKFLLKDIEFNSKKVLIERWINNNISKDWFKNKECLFSTTTCRIAINNLELGENTIYLELIDDGFDEKVTFQLKLIKPNEETGPISLYENETIQTRPTIFCYGCSQDKKCYPFGYRKEETFCSSEAEKFILQMKDGYDCKNNFECIINNCVSNKCIRPTLTEKIINWFKNLFNIKQ